MKVLPGNSCDGAGEPAALYVFSVAEFVAQSCTLLFRRFSICRRPTDPRAPEHFKPSAECNSAIQSRFRIGTLRALGNLRYFGASLRAFEKEASTKAKAAWPESASAMGGAAGDEFTVVRSGFAAAQA